MSLDRVIQEGYQVVGLITMVSDVYKRTCAHGIPIDVIKMQAEALQIPITFINSTPDYESQLVNAFIDMKENQNVDTVIFGSLYEESDRQWNEQASEKAGLKSEFPLWIHSSEVNELVDEWMQLGYKATICRVKEGLDKSWVGANLNSAFFTYAIDYAICPMGEMGEYHTFVLDGPSFKKRLELTNTDIVLNSGLWSLDIKGAKLTKKS
jgi:diphthine-ammonia ligase